MGYQTYAKKLLTKAKKYVFIIQAMATCINDLSPEVSWLCLPWGYLSGLFWECLLLVCWHLQKN